MFPSSNKAFIKCHNGGSALTTGRAFSNGASDRLVVKQVLPKVMLRVVKKLTILMLWPMHHQIILKIAVAVVFPHNTNLTNGVGPSIARDIINLYNQHHPMN